MAASPLHRMLAFRWLSGACQFFHELPHLVLGLIGLPYVTTVRIAHPISGRPSPDRFGKVFHVASPIQDQIGVITPSSLHYIATTRGSYMPDIDPKTHTVMIHGLVDQPLTFTMDDLKRFPQVTKLHFVECAGNRRTVEVSTDGGKTWKPAQIVGTPQRMAHVRFTYPWNWDGVSDLN
jgi:hypothetical protein